MVFVLVVLVVLVIFSLAPLAFFDFIDLLEVFGVLGDLLEVFGVLGDLLEVFGVLGDLLEVFGVLGDLLEVFGVLGDLLEVFGVLEVLVLSVLSHGPLHRPYERLRGGLGVIVLVFFPLLEERLPAAVLDSFIHLYSGSMVESSCTCLGVSAFSTCLLI